ncbi:DNA gyrase subunit A [Adlercreutzia equolifaciens subsp. celatus]|uniref:DNA gyrase subunit A n=2 Tax=Adlercreutzia equolifaciens TaxID=446660 RepID=A0A3N0APD1_9ACTN|nr:DNA gyrase subunit A [Adlercreutzia equolifaciens]MCP2078624.1 DNA gyrase subunit A (EC 5.99.1.3) [Adlercreutzia equolifaciens subsp. celatus DSM 18785]RFT81484.1 DNA gyrase subunit A [Adlercreutzia equolifaciens]RFT93171.1 DNA gyrase subunit A [Adlercreutzia equolifaciens subsp. celatus]RNL36701.1 DNA gyrase subunit A [Adlercreutzia equolifaciens subsp. celatus DSM 18785]BAN78246.1 DNA gyrase A subunit [Adlercreutzia equolifaciens DSM 19450]
MADNFDEFDDDRDEVEAAEEDALYLAEEVNTDDEGDDDAELASASSTLDEEEDVEDADEDGNEPGFISEEERARSLMVDMPNPHGSIIEGANGGEGTIVRAAFLGKEMQTSFLEYSMSVIVSRALPDVRDGLKPVHRRILYAMNESGYTPNKPHMKSARTVGDVIGKYHPHGDSAVYDTMVRLAQPFSLRLPLIDGHGNFGSIDGDSAAAMRYTEARLDKPAMELLRDLDKETVDFQPNYDESLQEPTVLPSRFPNLLVNGSNGIAVGMATNIPPHNLGEAIDATCLMIDNPDCTTEDLLTAMPGPDFPTGGLIMGKKGILDAYETGHGNLTIRAKCEIEEKKNGRASIVVKEIPYQVNRKRLLEKLGELVRDKKLPEISNIHDAADRKGIDIIIDLKSNAIPQVVLNKLFKHTQLQVGFGCNMLALVNGTPRVLSLKEILFYYIEHQKDVVTRRTRYELAKAEEREHILEGYIIALDNIDEVIHIIRSSETDKEAAARLTERFGLSEKQTNAILEMRLRRLTGLERTKIEEELAELREKIAYYKQILADENLLKQVIKEELQEIKKKYNTPRRTRLTGEAKDIEVEDLIAEENMVVTMTKAGYIKRLPVSTYRQQKRGGKGMQGVNLKDADFVEHLFVASTHSYMLFFSTKGKVYRLKVYEIPEAGRHARGTAIVNLLPLEKGESISAVIATKDFPAEEFLMFATAQGNVKKTSMDQYDRTRRDGLIAINLKDGDELISVKRVAKGEKVIMVSSAGKAILWDESEARAMGRGTMGVRGMNVPADAHVLGMEIAKPGTDLFVITEKGYGKRTKIEEYPEHHRGGQGVYTITMTHKKGLLSVMKIVGPDDEIMIVSEDGVIVRTPVKGISELGRSTQGVKVMNVADKDKVCAVAIASTGKKKAKKAAPADENQMGLLEEESEEGTLAIDDLDDDLGDEGEETEE